MISYCSRGALVSAELWLSIFDVKRRARRGLAGVVTGLLLQLISRAQIARIERLSPCEAFILPVVITNPVFAQFPAQINFLIVDDRRKIKQTDIQILN